MDCPKIKIDNPHLPDSTEASHPSDHHGQAGQRQHQPEALHGGSRDTKTVLCLFRGCRKTDVEPHYTKAFMFQFLDPCKPGYYCYGMGSISVEEHKKLAVQSPHTPPKDSDYIGRIFSWQFDFQKCNFLFFYLRKGSTKLLVPFLAFFWCGISGCMAMLCIA